MEENSPIQKMDMPIIRQNLSKLRQDWRSSCPESVFRISTVLSNGMSYAEFTLHFLLRNKKKPSDQTPIQGVRKKRTRIPPGSISPPLPLTRVKRSTFDTGMDLAKDFAEVVGKVEEGTQEPIQHFLVRKRKRKTKPKE